MAAVLLTQIHGPGQPCPSQLSATPQPLLCLSLPFVKPGKAPSLGWAERRFESGWVTVSSSSLVVLKQPCDVEALTPPEAGEN